MTAKNKKNKKSKKRVVTFPDLEVLKLTEDQQMALHELFLWEEASSEMNLVLGVPEKILYGKYIDME